MLRRPCPGAIASRVHATHTLFRTGELVWCAKCGSYARRVPRRLRMECPGGPQTDADKSMLRRLRNGRLPAPKACLNSSRHTEPVQQRPVPARAPARCEASLNSGYCVSGDTSPSSYRRASGRAAAACSGQVLEFGRAPSKFFHTVRPESCQLSGSMAALASSGRQGGGNRDGLCMLAATITDGVCDVPSAETVTEEGTGGPVSSNSGSGNQSSVEMIAVLDSWEAATECATEAAALRDLMELEACGMRVRWPPGI